MTEQAELEDDFEVLELIEPDEGREAEDNQAGSQDEPPEIGFADEAAPASDGENETGLVAKLRAEIRKRDKELAQHRDTAPARTVVVGEKPTFESCEYDPERFETDLQAWTERSNQAARLEDERQAAWKRELDQVNAQRAALKIPPAEYDKAQAAVNEAMTDLQLAVLVRAANNPAALIYALGKSPDRLEGLAAITDPVKLSAAVGRLEDKIKMTQRRTPPPPEGTVRGSAPLSKAAADKTLERLEKEAERTNDRTKVVQYKRQMTEKAK